MESNKTDSPLPPKIRSQYYDFKVTSRTTIYLVIQARSQATHEIHTIRALNSDAPFVTENFDLASTLFIQELLHFCEICPKSVFIESFEIYKDKIAFATLPYVDSSNSDFKIPSEKLKHKLFLEKMLKDLTGELEFLSAKINLVNFASIIQRHNIFYLKEYNRFFLGDWASVFTQKNLIKKSGDVQEYPPRISFTQNIITSPSIQQSKPQMTQSTSTVKISSINLNQPPQWVTVGVKKTHSVSVKDQKPVASSPKINLDDWSDLIPGKVSTTNTVTQNLSYKPIQNVNEREWIKKESALIEEINLTDLNINLPAGSKLHLDEEFRALGVVALEFCGVYADRIEEIRKQKEKAPLSYQIAMEDLIAENKLLNAAFKELLKKTINLVEMPKLPEIKKTVVVIKDYDNKNEQEQEKLIERASSQIIHRSKGIDYFLIYIQTVLTIHKMNQK